MRRTGSVWDTVYEAAMQWDNSDVEPAQPAARRTGRPPPIPIKVKDASGRPVSGRKLPGMGEATAQQPAPPQSRRRRSDVTQPPPMAGTPRPPGPTDYEPTPADRSPIKLEPGERSFDVFIPGDGTYRVPARDEAEAISRMKEFLAGQGERREVQMRATLSPVGNEGATAGDMGTNAPGLDEFKDAVRRGVREIVRKKKGGGGFALYAPNKGKKKNPKPVGEFPTRFAAKKAELARFPPKDPEQLKRARARLDKISKDPKKRADAERKDLAGVKEPKRSGAPARSRKARKEGIVRLLARDLQERLFHDEEVPGSPWDEHMTSLHPDAISSDRKLHALHRGMEKASIGALNDACKGLTKALRGVVRVHPGDVSFDDERKKTFMAVMMDVDGFEIGPVHLYVDGGHVRIELSGDAREAITQLEPDLARDLRGGLMTFEEDHLPRIDGAQRAWRDRDTYLDKLHARLSKHAAGMSDVEHHIMKGLLKGGKRK